MRTWIEQGHIQDGFPIIYVFSDSIGITGQSMARVTAAAFDVFDPAIVTYSGASGYADANKALCERLAMHRAEQKGNFFLLYTAVDEGVKQAVSEFVSGNDDVVAGDLLEMPVSLASTLTDKPVGKKAGAYRDANEEYFRRIEAMEFTVNHDDGGNPQDLTKADIVLIGVSRTSKTPLSIYLSQQGYKVANVPLDPVTQPPRELEDVEAGRLYGLITSPEVLCDIRKRRHKNASYVAGSYADYEQVCKDLEKSRALMRKLGCIVINTKEKAIEETAQEILRYYSVSHPLR